MKAPDERTFLLGLDKFGSLFLADSELLNLDTAETILYFSVHNSSFQEEKHITFFCISTHCYASGPV